MSEPLEIIKARHEAYKAGLKGSCGCPYAQDICAVHGIIQQVHDHTTGDCTGNCQRLDDGLD